MPHSDATPGVFLPPSAFAVAFPFHIVVGPDMRVRQAGASIARVLPGVCPGAPLCNHFRLVRPPFAFDFESLAAHPRSVVLLEALAHPLRLRGQMLHLPDQDCIAFLCSPVTTDISAVSELGLAVNDFAIHDSTVDFMLVLQSARATLADLQSTTELLRAERSELRQVRARLQRLLQASPTVIYTCMGVAPYDLTFLSENATRHFGNLPLAHPQTLFDHAHPDDRDELRAAFDTAVRDGRAAVVYRLRVGNGYHWRQDLLEASAGDDGVELVGASHDVHQLIETERALDDINTRSRAMLDTAPDGVIALDDQGHVLEFNGSAERIFACNRSQALGVDFERFIPGFTRAKLPAAAATAVMPECQPGVPEACVPQDITACTWDGREFPAELSLARIERRYGATYVGFVRDITDRHLAVADLLRARDEAEMANLAKREFLARMSHEIRTPLYAILGMAELVRASQLSLEQRDWLEAVRSSSDALLFLINDLLDFSKIEAGQLRLEQSVFDVWELLEGVTDSAALKATAKGLRVTCWIDPDVPRQIISDPNRLRQIATNLTGNAVKFTDVGEVVLRVSVDIDGTGGGPHLHLAVSDTGRGIAEANQARVFDRFFQADPSNPHDVAGTGLGLNITRTLVGLLGGTIGIDSSVGHGACFDVRLPLHDVPTQTHQRTWSKLPSAPVMVVVPGAAAQGMVRCHLEFHGCEVHVVATAAAALAALGARHYAAMVIDDGLPDETGFELIRTIRSDRAHEAVRLVLLSSGPSAPLFGAVGVVCVVKPLHADRLLDALDEARTAARLDEAPTPTPTPTLASGDRTRPTRILVAEDNPQNQRVATRFLESAGARVEIALDGQAAVEMAAKTRYDVILMDLQMPVVDGKQAAVAIRDAEHRRNDEPVPIVAFTAHAVEGVRQQCLAAGMNDYIVKPITGRDLVNTVHRWVDRRPAVLVADDASAVRDLVELSLRDTYRIVQATNGQEALEQFARQPIALVMLDLNMPVLDGYATAAAIRLRDDGQQVPIVALTGADGEDARDRARAAGCTMHLVKPVRRATLLSAVDTAMHQGAEPVVEPEPPEEPPASVTLDIDPFLADLVPGYVREQRRQMADLRRLVTDGDMDRLKRIAHNLKGTGASYGIPDVTRLGRALEAAGQQGDALVVSALIEELDALLARVQVQLGVS